MGLEGAPGTGMTKLGLSLLAEFARQSWVACVDVRGWLNPGAAWDLGLPAERLTIVRCSDSNLWPQVTAALLEGMGAVYAEVPSGISPSILRRLAALSRSRSSSLILRTLNGEVPSGVAHTRLEAREVSWMGAESGFGRLQIRHMTLSASGKGVSGVPQLIEMEDDGEDAMRMVSRLAVAMPAGAVG